MGIGPDGCEPASVHSQTTSISASSGASVASALIALRCASVTSSRARCTPATMDSGVRTPWAAADDRLARTSSAGSATERAAPPRR